MKRLVFTMLLAACDTANEPSDLVECDSAWRGIVEECALACVEPISVMPPDSGCVIPNITPAEGCGGTMSSLRTVDGVRGCCVEDHEAKLVTWHVCE